MVTALPWATACDRADDDVSGDDDTSEVGDDDTTAADDDSADDDDDDDSAGDDDTSPPPAAVSDLAWSVHPQVATVLEVTWTQLEDSDASWVEFIYPGNDWVTSPEGDGSVGEHREWLFGLPAEAAISFRIVNRVGDEIRLGEELVGANTDALPEDLPLAQALGWNETLTSDDRWFLLSLEVQDEDWYQGPFWVLVLDRLGRVVWYYAVPDDRCTMHGRTALSGDHMLFEETTIYTGDEGAGSLLRRMTLDMAFDETTPVPGLGSTFAETDDGLILFDDYTDFPETWLEELHPDGTRRRIWLCNDWADQHDLPVWGCDPNETIWVRDTDTVLWSMWWSDSVLELERETGAIVHQWGRMPGSWDFEPAGVGFEMQHYPHYTDAGTLLVSTHIPNQPSVHRIREFELDPMTETLTEIWTYGEGLDLWPRYAGGAFWLHNGNVLINYGTDARIREITHDDQQLVWEIAWDSDYLIGHVTALQDLYAIGRGEELAQTP